MKINYIRLINFKQYYSEQTAEISDLNDLNITVFHGLNGAGKTSLFIAFNWCLYETGVENTGEILNKRAFFESPENGLVPLAVTVCFKHLKNDYIAERFIKFRKTGEISVKEEEGFSVSRIDSNGNTVYLPNPKIVMNSILPENVREYFFFDGERMEDLTRPDNTKIEDAIQNIMRLPIIDNAEKHISGIANEFRRELKREGSNQLEKIINEEETIEKKIQEKRINKEKLQEEIRLGRQQISDLEKSLRENEKSRRLQETRDNLINRRNELEDLKRNLIEHIRSNSTCLFSRYLSEISKNALKIADEKRRRGQIPSGIKEQFINDLLEKDFCICGRKISIDDSAKQHIREYLNKAPSDKLEDMVLGISGDVRVLSFHSQDSLQDLENSCKQKALIDQKIEDISKEIDENKHELGDSPDIDISNIQNNLSEFQKKQSLNQNTLGRHEQEIETLLESLAEIVKSREKEEKKQMELRLLSKKEELARRSSEAIENIKNEFYERTRIEIEKETKRVFSELAWKQDHFKDIQLDQDFRLEIIDKWGRPSREEISAGERQILSLSFIAAMARLSGEEAPIIMDTPFGRLSGNHLEKVASEFPELVPQLILMVTDREWEGTSGTGIQSRVGYQYKLTFDENTSCTEIKEVENE
jgi:DNA sulfur modification protein DndD